VIMRLGAPHDPVLGLLHTTGLSSSTVTSKERRTLSLLKRTTYPPGPTSLASLVLLRSAGLTAPGRAALRSGFRGRRWLPGPVAPAPLPAGKYGRGEQPEDSYQAGFCLSLNPPGLRVFCGVLAGQEPSSIRRALHPEGERPQLQEWPVTRPDERLQRRYRVDSRAT
jgi:hypothetical protein